MAWGKEWPVIAKLDPEEAKALGEIWEKSKADPKAWPELKNKHPTHDPYTNPGAFLYYECNCGQVLDPKVKSFASLNNAAMNAGWKVRWGPTSYVPYCVKCGEGVE
jgi:hypothetical protein